MYSFLGNFYYKFFFSLYVKAIEILNQGQVWCVNFVVNPPFFLWYLNYPVFNYFLNLLGYIIETLKCCNDVDDL